MYIVYLAGQISTNPETYRWRKRVREFFNYEPKFNSHLTIIDPCQSAWNQKVLTNGRISKNGLSIALNQKVWGLLPHKDRQHVRRSTIALANMNIYSPEEPSIGTIYELAWYFDDPAKMVIGIHEDHRNDLRCQHPFVQATVHTWVKDEIEACKLLVNLLDV